MKLREGIKVPTSSRNVLTGRDCGRSAGATGGWRVLLLFLVLFALQLSLLLARSGHGDLLLLILWLRRDRRRRAEFRSSTSNDDAAPTTASTARQQTLDVGRCRRGF